MIPARVEPARSVHIAIPSYSGELFPETQKSLVAGLYAFKEEGIEVEAVHVLPGCCYLDHARNILVGRFLRGSATDLIFIDADVGFGPASLLRLCSQTRPLVAGIYPKKVDPPEYPVNVLGDEIWADREGLVDCSMVPTGFMRIHRSVFEGLTVPRYAHPDGELGAYFKCEVRDGQYWGEDVEFCRLVREAGGQAWAFAEMDLSHSSPHKVHRGNWGKHLLSQLKEAA